MNSTVCLNAHVGFNICDTNYLKYYVINDTTGNKKST